MLWPIQPTANNRIAAAIETKMSLKPVIRRNCSSSGIAVDRCPWTCARRAFADSVEITPAFTASSSSCWLYMRFSPENRGKNIAGVLWCQYTSICRTSGKSPSPSAMNEISSAGRRADTIFDLPTPALILDRSKLEANAARMRERARNLGVTLRPHVKTSKSIDVLRILSGGIDIPITVSTLAEAQYFFAHGVRDILYAVGIAPVKLPASRRTDPLRMQTPT